MIVIRPAGVTDLQVIQQLAHTTWPVAYGTILTEEQLKYMLEKFYSLPSLQHQSAVLKHHFILAYMDEMPVGFASFSLHEKYRVVYHLNKIYILPAMQGKNIGTQILEYIINKIKKSSASSLQLHVNRNNKAMKFYEKQGFRIIGREDNDIGEGYFMNDYVMELKW